MGLRDASASKNFDCLVIHHNFLVMEIIHMPPQPPFYSWPYPFIISNLKFNLFALLQNLMPKAALDMAMFTKKGQNPKLVSQKYDVSAGCGFGCGCGCGKAFRDTFHTKESLLKIKAKAQQDLGNDCLCCNLHIHVFGEISEAATLMLLTLQTTSLFESHCRRKFSRLRPTL